MSLRSNRVTAGEVFQGSFTILEAGVEGQRAEVLGQAQLII